MQENLNFHLSYILRFQVKFHLGDGPGVPSLSVPLSHYPTLASVASRYSSTHTWAGLDVNTNHGSPLPLGLGSPHKLCPHPIFLPSSK